jgi:predicted permease
VDLTLVLFAGLITLLTGILVVLIPVFRFSKLQLESSLRDAGRTAFGNRWGNRAHDALVMTEVAVAVVLVVASGLLVRSISEMYRQGPGFDPENVFYLRVSRNNWGIRQQLQEETESRQEYFQAMRAWTSPRNNEIEARLASLPGVTSIASGRVPMLNYYRLFPVTAIDGQSGAEPTEAQCLGLGADEDYFEILRIPLLRGRTFEARDKGTENVIVSEKLASRLWGDRDPIGKRLRSFGDEHTVIGVVGNVRQEGMHKPSQPTLYWPRGDGGATQFLIRTNRTLEGLLPELRQAVRQADATAFIRRTVPLKDAVLETIWRVHYSLILLGGLSALALVLALVGLYSTLSYIVRARTGEIGLRMALGADQRDVLRLVLRHGLAVVAMGLLLGLIGSAALTRFLSNLLFGVTPTDPLTFVSVACAIMATAMIAAYLPARRASKVDPMVALRHE